MTHNTKEAFYFDVERHIIPFLKKHSQVLVKELGMLIAPQSIW